MMNVLALSSVSLEINIGAHSASANLGQLCINIESESTELADVNGVALAEVLVEVSHKAAPDDQHLQSRVKQFKS